ncbi:MAG: hypothetical protein M1828_001012 [Chrysothrix sp. TS-e1954]|nr:MAG: hypothetical protein M1828_001012 [Chrysothrix sp. TS-e1954]
MGSQQPKQISTPSGVVVLPKVTITYCTQCGWMLRAAYFAQELLSTFSTALGEVSLKPATGGTFFVNLDYAARVSPAAVDGDGDGEGKEEKEEELRRVVIWDRKVEGGFPETKVLKQRVRDHIQPEKDLGHSDVGGKKNDKKNEEAVTKTTRTEATPGEAPTEVAREVGSTREARLEVQDSFSVRGDTSRGTALGIPLSESAARRSRRAALLLPKRKGEGQDRDQQDKGESSKTPTDRTSETNTRVEKVGSNFQDSKQSAHDSKWE